jgi:hypothetical protein
MKRAEVADPVPHYVERVEVGEVLQRCDVREDFVAADAKFEEVGQVCDWSQVADSIVVQTEVAEFRKVCDWGNVGDLIPVQVEGLKVCEEFETFNVGNGFTVRVDDVGAVDEVLGEGVGGLFAPLSCQVCGQIWVGEALCDGAGADDAGVVLCADRVGGRRWGEHATPVIAATDKVAMLSSRCFHIWRVLVMMSPAPSYEGCRLYGPVPSTA